jgi:hypothetical protein
VFGFFSGSMLALYLSVSFRVFREQTPSAYLSRSFACFAGRLLPPLSYNYRTKYFRRAPVSFSESLTPPPLRPSVLSVPPW